MSRSDLSQPTYNDQSKARPAIVMPRLSRSEMLAILRESGVPESDARSWIERDWTLAAESAVES